MSMDKTISEKKMEKIEAALLKNGKKYKNEFIDYSRIECNFKYLNN